MQNDWILDVLADLRDFAKANELGGLAASLDETAFIAATELASHREEARARVWCDARGAGSNTVGLGRHPGA